MYYRYFYNRNIFYKVQRYFPAHRPSGFELSLYFTKYIYTIQIRLYYIEFIECVVNKNVIFWRDENDNARKERAQKGGTYKSLVEEINTA